MPVKIQPTSVIETNLGINRNGKIQKFFVNECYKAMDKYVPMNEGNLRTNVDIQPDHITYESPYAHAQYVGMTTGPVKNYTTPGTGPYWDKRMWSVDGPKIIEMVQHKIDLGGY